MDLPYIDIIRMKHFFGIVEIDVKKKPPKDLRAEVARMFRDAHPLVLWLREASQGVAE